MELTAYDGNQWRVDRLEKLVRIVCKITGLTREQLGALIDSIHDHKGELLVHWKHQGCSARMQLAFKDAWSECGENNVHHIADGGL